MTRGELVNSSPDGVHYLIEFFGCNEKQLDSVAFWKRLLLDAVSNADLTVLNKHFHRFMPHGITGYILLSTSHISVHTWPEYGYAACDVFSCGSREETKDIVKHIRKHFDHHEAKTRKISRGYRVGSAHA